MGKAMFENVTCGEIPQEIIVRVLEEISGKMSSLTSLDPPAVIEILNARFKKTPREHEK